MKKIYSLIMAFTLLLTFTACSNNTNDESSSSAQQQSGTPFHSLRIPYLLANQIIKTILRHRP